MENILFLLFVLLVVSISVSEFFLWKMRVRYRKDMLEMQERLRTVVPPHQGNGSLRQLARLYGLEWREM